jgi:acetyltransferase
MQSQSERSEKVKKLLNPNSIAVVGASSDTRKPGGRVIQYLADSGFSGNIYPINPNQAEILGKKAYASLETLPEVPDCVVVSVPAAAVQGVVDSCNRIGVPATIIFSSGFKEVATPEGLELEAQLQEAVGGGTLILGPNCQGIINFFTGCVANFSSALADASIAEGSVGVVSQSGLFAALIADSLKDRCGIGYVATTGNEIDVEFGDLVMAMATDPKIEVIVGYLEAIRDVERFKEAARVARENGKPLVILKVGKTAEAAEAAKSHTGALSSPAFLYDSLFDTLGIISVNTLTELTEAAYLYSCKLPTMSGSRVAVMTNSGGLGVLCTDLLKPLDLELAKLDAETTAKIQSEMHAFGAYSNPVDIATLAITDMPAVQKILESLVVADNVDIVALVLAFTHANAQELCQTIVDLAEAHQKPIVVCWMSSDGPAKEILVQAGVPTFDTPMGALRAAANIRQLHIGMGRSASAESFATLDLKAFRDLVETTRAAGRHFLSEFDAMRVLNDLGVPTPTVRRITDVKQIASALDACGSPVVMKIDSDEIAHKSDVGGVILPVVTRQDAETAHETILRNVAKNCPEQSVNGTLMCQMVSGGYELIVGGMRDPVLGPYVMVGFGGIYAETIRDVSFRPAPVTQEDAGEMLRELKMFPVLAGTRGRAAIDLSDLESVIATVSVLLATVDGIEEIDLNPVIVGSDAGALVAVDALVTFS